MWHIDVGIPTYDESEESVERAYTLSYLIQHNVGILAESSGCGLGFRDMQFVVDTFEEAHIIALVVLRTLQANNIVVDPNGIDTAYIEIGSIPRLP